MNSVDVAILVLLLLGLVVGWKVKASRLVFRLIALGAGLGVAARYGPAAEKYFGFLAPLPASLTSRLVLMVTVVIIGLLLENWFSRWCERWNLQHLNRGAGALLVGGLAFGLILASLSILDATLHASQWRAFRRSRLVPPLLRLVPAFAPPTHPVRAPRRTTRVRPGPREKASAGPRIAPKSEGRFQKNSAYDRCHT